MKLDFHRIENPFGHDRWTVRLLHDGQEIGELYWYFMRQAYSLQPVPDYTYTPDQLIEIADFAANLTAVEKGGPQ